jgi:hypothetical protein
MVSIFSQLHPKPFSSSAQHLLFYQRYSDALLPHVVLLFTWTHNCGEAVPPALGTNMCSIGGNHSKDG